MGSYYRLIILSSVNSITTLEWYVGGIAEVRSTRGRKPKAPKNSVRVSPVFEIEWWNIHSRISAIVVEPTIILRHGITASVRHRLSTRLFEQKMGRAWRTVCIRVEKLQQKSI